MWVVRNKDGILYVFAQKPVRNLNINKWVYSDKLFPDNGYPLIGCNDFENITWNSEPEEVNLFSNKTLSDIKSKEWDNGYKEGYDNGYDRGYYHYDYEEDDDYDE